MALVEKVVQKRRAWEKLRAEYANNFPSMKCCLPQNATEMSKYALSKESAMSEAELKEVRHVVLNAAPRPMLTPIAGRTQLKEKKNVLFQSLREARSAYRAAITKVKGKDYFAAVKELERAEGNCAKAQDLAESIKDDELKSQATDIMEEVRARA